MPLPSWTVLQHPTDIAHNQAHSVFSGFDQSPSLIWHIPPAVVLAHQQFSRAAIQPLSKFLHALSGLCRMWGNHQDAVWTSFLAHKLDLCQMIKMSTCNTSTLNHLFLVSLKFMKFR